MISARLIELIENHAPELSRDITRELTSSERTQGFRNVKRDELQSRIFDLLKQLGNWIGEPNSEHVVAEFGDWGRRRFKQGIPLSEILYAIIILKKHLQRYIHDNGLVDASFPRVDGDYVLPMHLHSLQELIATVDAFFDEALYGLACGYEGAAATHV